MRAAVSSAVGRVEHLPPISLTELVREAELLVRVDRKYVLALADLDVLLAEAPRGTRVLEIDGRREFGYRSTYLDTPDLRSFHGSGRSQRDRWKVRGRTYLDTGGSWLEVKTAGSRSQTVKQRVAHPQSVEDGLSGEGTALVADVIGAELTRSLRPVLVTAYRRSTLLLPGSGAGARVTVDVDLGWTSLRTGSDLERSQLAIVETKTGSTPSALDRRLWAHGHRPVRISKYGAGLAALHPELPRLKWHRALDRHLSCPRQTTRGDVTP